VIPPGYRLVREIAGGFEAIDREHREVIVELGTIDPALASVRHLGLARIYEIGDGFIAYERLTTPIRAWTKTASNAQRIAAWTLVLRALAAIHRAGLVHGRVSADHVFVDGARVVLAGFARPIAGSPTAMNDQLAVCMALDETLAKPIDRYRAAAIQRGLAVDPATRWPDADALADALETSASQRLPWMLVVIVLGVIAALAVVR